MFSSLVLANQIWFSKFAQGLACNNSCFVFNYGLRHFIPLIFYMTYYSPQFLSIIGESAMVVIVDQFVSAIDTYITDVFWCIQSHFMKSKSIIMKQYMRGCVGN